MAAKRHSESSDSTEPKTKRSSSASSSRFSPDQIIIGVSVVISIVIVAVVLYVSVQNDYMVNSEIEGLETFTGLVATHVTTSVTYMQTPPVGGPHNPTWQTCGVYTSPLANEFAVHSLEHGAVWITYQPELAEDQVRALQDITTRGTHRLLSPYPGIDSPIIISAWGYQLRLERADDARLMQFIAQYEQGPTTPEPGATCSGGETRTLAQMFSG